MTTNDVSDTRISTELREVVAWLLNSRFPGNEHIAVRAADKISRAVDALASRHPQPVNEPDEWQGMATIDRAMNCEVWPKWLSDAVELANQASDAADMSTEQAVAYGILQSLRAASIPAPERSVGVKVDEIAKIIDPHSFMPVGELEPDDHWTENMVEQGMELARSKARRILSALETPPLHKEGDHIPATSEGQATCDDCAGLVISWRAPDALWNRVMGGPDAKDDPGGIICPNCFIRRAELAGVAPAAWLVDAPQPTPDAGEVEPAYWEYELATQHFSSGYDNWEPRLTKHHPHVPEGAVRNLRPLFYAAPQPTPVAPVPVTITDKDGSTDELMKLAADLGEPDDPFAAWEALASIKSEHARMKSALVEISCPSQTDRLLWWQIAARAALSKPGEQG